MRVYIRGLSSSTDGQMLGNKTRILKIILKFKETLQIGMRHFKVDLASDLF